MEQFLLELVNRGLAASLLAVVVILLRQFFKKMPKWVRLVLWGFVAFRLLCPISLETSFSLMPDVAKVSRTVEENLEPEVQILPKADVSENPVSDNFVVQDKIEEGKTDIVWTEPEPDRSVQEEDIPSCCLRIVMLVTLAKRICLSWTQKRKRRLSWTQETKKRSGHFPSGLSYGFPVYF